MIPRNVTGCGLGGAPCGSSRAILCSIHIGLTWQGKAGDSTRERPFLIELLLQPTTTDLEV